VKSFIRYIKYLVFEVLLKISSIKYIKTKYQKSKVKINKLALMKVANHLKQQKLCFSIKNGRARLKFLFSI